MALYTAWKKASASSVRGIFAALRILCFMDRSSEIGVLDGGVRFAGKHREFTCGDADT
jgi:hypothetical protein